MSNPDVWDFDLQHDQTAYTLAELTQTTDLNGGESIVLDLEFVAANQPDPEGLLRKFKMFGYTAEQREDGALNVEVPNVSFTLEDIWLHEERTTKLALLHGYLPDGWGFWEPET